MYIENMSHSSVAHSVTRLGDLLDFGQVFKAFGSNLFAQISHILGQIFLVKSFFGNFNRHLAIFSSHTGGTFLIFPTVEKERYKVAS